jgi:hypothetical protein
MCLLPPLLGPQEPMMEAVRIAEKSYTSRRLQGVLPQKAIRRHELKSHIMDYGSSFVINLHSLYLLKRPVLQLIFQTYHNISGYFQMHSVIANIFVNIMNLEASSLNFRNS